MLEFLQALFLVVHYSYYMLMTFLMMLFVICYIVIYVDDTTLYCKCDQVYDLWQQLELPSELESDLQNTVHCDRK